MAEKSWWQQPKLRTDEEEGIERRTSWLELFYDLVFIVVVAELAQRLAGDISWSGLAGYALLFIPAWWLWFSNTMYNNRFETEDVSHRLFTLLRMLPVAGLGIFASNQRTDTSIGYILAYVAGRLLLIFLWLRAGQHNAAFRPVALRYAVGFSISAIIWTTSLATPVPARFLLWSMALLVDLITPLLTQKQQATLPGISSSHLPERFGLFTIIVLGEAVVGVVRGVAGAEPLTIATGLQGVLAMGIAFALWWIYFDFVIRRLLKPHVPWRTIRSYLHLPLLMSIVAIGAGVRSIVANQDRQLDSEERWLIAGAVALALTMIGLIEYTIPAEDDDAFNHSWSIPLKVAASLLTLLLAGWVTTSALLLLSGLFAVLLIPVVYGTVRWFQQE